MSLNTQGLSDLKKRRDVFQYLRQKSPSMLLLQDTHFKKSLERQITTEWGYKCYFASNTSQSRGVAVLMNNNFDFKVNKVVIDVAGNYIILVIKTMETEITLVNIYGPNRDDRYFMKTFKT
jgi:exonuclease III